MTTRILHILPLLFSNQFVHTKSIVNTTDYEISISNNKLQDYEKLQYKLTVLKDQYPSISVSLAPDSLKLKQKVVIGQISDDYGISALQVVYYDVAKPNVIFRKLIPFKNKLVDQFIYSFPDGITLRPGIDYDYYFEVFDNDAINGKNHLNLLFFSQRTYF